MDISYGNPFNTLEVFSRKRCRKNLENNWNTFSIFFQYFGDKYRSVHPVFLCNFPTLSHRGRRPYFRADCILITSNVSHVYIFVALGTLSATVPEMKTFMLTLPHRHGPLLLRIPKDLRLVVAPALEIPVTLAVCSLLFALRVVILAFLRDFVCPSSHPRLSQTARESFSFLRNLVFATVRAVTLVFLQPCVCNLSEQSSSYFTRLRRSQTARAVILVFTQTCVCNCPSSHSRFPQPCVCNLSEQSSSYLRDLVVRKLPERSFSFFMRLVSKLSEKSFLIGCLDRCRVNEAERPH